MWALRVVSRLFVMVPRFLRGKPLRLDIVLIQLDGNIGRFLVQIVSEVVEVLPGNGPGGIVRVSLLLADVGQVILLEELILIGWAGGCAELDGEADKRNGGTERGAFGGAGEVGLKKIERWGQERAEAVGLIVPEGLALTIKLGLEEGVIDAPSGDGGAVDFDGVGDLLVGVAAEEEVDGDGLFGGECVCAFVAFVANGVG